MQRLIIDCDPGIDDALALLLAAAARPQIELVAVTAVAGNRPLVQTVRNAARVLALAGRDDVPLHAGCARPIDRPEPRCNLVHGEGGLGGVELADGRPPDPQHACDALAAQLLAAAPGTLAIAAVGPLTNLALAELRHPGLLRRARELLVMGGAAFGPGNVTPVAEFNVWADPVAAQIVLDAGARLRLFGLDVTRQARLPADWIAGLAALGTRSAAAVQAMWRGYANADALMHDVCPIAWLLQPGLFGGAPCTLRVDCRDGPTFGQTLAWPAGRSDSPAPPNAELMTRVDNAGLLALLRTQLARLP